MKVFCSLFISLLFCLTLHAQVNTEANQEDSVLHAYAVALWKQGQYDSALSVAKRAMALASLSGDSVLIGKCFNDIGMIYCSKGDPAKSILHLDESLIIFKSLNIQDQIPGVLLNMGIAHKLQGTYDKALNNLFEAAVLFEQKKNLMYLSSAYNTIGNIFRIEKRYTKSLEYHSNALELRREIAYDKGIAGSLNNIGAVYMDLGDYDSAMYYFNLSLKLKEIGKLPKEKVTTLSHIAEIHYLNKDYVAAEKFYTEAHHIFEQSHNKVGLAGSFFDLARLNHAKLAFHIAEQQAFNAISLAEETGASDIRLKCYDLLKRLYSDKKNFSQALYYAELFIVLNDSLLGEDKQKSLSQLEFKYETEKKQRELDRLNREKEKTEALLLLKDLQLEVKSSYNKNLVITLILLASVIILLLLLFRNRTRFANKLDIIIRELHHRVKNNFQVLLSLFNLQLDTIQDKSTRALIDGNRNRITAMMLIHSGLYFDEDVTRVKIGNYIQNLVQNLLVIYDLTPDRVRIHYDIDENLDIDVDKSIPLGLLINELVTNAFKYAFNDNNPDPSLRVYFRKHEGMYHLIIEDNGPGMEGAIQKKSFGLKLAETQAKQLKGILQTKNEHGLKYEIIFE